MSGQCPVRLKVWGQEVAVLSLCDLLCYNVKNVELVQFICSAEAICPCQGNELSRLIGHVVND